MAISPASSEGEAADEDPSAAVTARDRQVAMIRSICNLRDDGRAIELLEAATGSVEGAVQIHFDSCSHIETITNPDKEANGRSATLRDRSGSPSEPSPTATVVSRKTETTSPRLIDDGNGDGRSDNQRKRQRQRTLDSYFGLPEVSKKKRDPQTRIKQYFRPKRPPSIGASTNTCQMERRNGPSTENIHDDGKSNGDDEMIPPIVKSISCIEDAPPRGDVLPEHGHTEQSSLPMEGSLQAADGTIQTLRDESVSGSSEANVYASAAPPPCVASTSSISSTGLMEIDVPYHWVSETLTAISDTTKRTAKLSALTGLFLRLLHHLELCGVQAAPWDGDAGEITNEKKNARRNKAVYVLTCTFDLVLGKLSILKGDSGEDCTATNSTPLQVSGSTVSSAVQTVTGATRMQLRQAYRTSGDLGDCAAQYFQPLSSMKRFFVLSDTDQSTKRSQGSRLTVTRVHETVQEIAVVAVGKGSQKRRQDLIVKLLRSSQDKAELRFLVRTLLGNMRLGATLKSVVAALAHAVVESGSNGAVPGDSVFEDASKALQKVFNVCPRLDRIVAALLTGGISYAVQHCTVEVFHPIQPMLANPAHSLEEVQQFMMLSSSRSNKSEWPAVAEWKYDGVRCQAHFDGVTVKLFSRNLIENTLQYPDVVEYILQAAASSVTSFIIDSELVAVSPSAQARDGFSLLPFQDLSTRRGGNKQGISSGTSICRIQVRIYAFDLIYLNGESLLQLPLRRRRELLMNHFITSDGFGFATSVPITRYDKALLESTLEASVQDGAEGLMIKLTGQSGTSEYGDIADELTQDFGYQSGTRSQLWLKLKRDYLSGEVGGTNTIDVVPVGAWFGMGRKAKNGFLSPVLLAVYDDDEGVFYSIARCMTFSDEMYAAMRGYYFHGTPYPDGVGLGDNESETVDDSASAAVTGEGYDAQSVNVEVASFGQEDDIDAPSRVNCLDTRPPWIVTNESPPIWFKPSEVFEVAFADLSLSTSHTAASTILGETRGRGIALRFPRFKRRRPDKNVEQATSLAEIARLFFQQSKVKSAGKL